MEKRENGGKWRQREKRKGKIRKKNGKGKKGKKEKKKKKEKTGKKGKKGGKRYLPLYLTVSWHEGVLLGGGHGTADLHATALSDAWMEGHV